MPHNTVEVEVACRAVTRVAYCAGRYEELCRTVIAAAKAYANGECSREIVENVARLAGDIGRLLDACREQMTTKEAFARAEHHDALHARVAALWAAECVADAVLCTSPAEIVGHTDAAQVFAMSAAAWTPSEALDPWSAMRVEEEAQAKDRQDLAKESACHEEP